MNSDALLIVTLLIKTISFALECTGLFLLALGMFSFARSLREEDVKERTRAIHRLFLAFATILIALSLQGTLNTATESKPQNEIVQNVDVEPEEDVIIEEPIIAEEPVIEKIAQEEDINQSSSSKDYSFLSLLIQVLMPGAAFACIISKIRKEKSLKAENVVENTKTDYEIFIETLAQNINKMREYLKFQQLSTPIKSSLKNIILSCEKIKENTDNTEFNTGNIKDINTKYIAGILMLLENYINLKKTKDNSNDCVKTLTEIEKTICDSEITFEEIFKESIEKEILEANTNTKTFRVQASIPNAIVKSDNTQFELKF